MADVTAVTAQAAELAAVAVIIGDDTTISAGPHLPWRAVLGKPHAEIADIKTLLALRMDPRTLWA